MRKLRLLPFALAGVLACMPNLPPDKPLAPPLKTKGYYYTFDTGLRLVVYEDPRAKEFMTDVSYAIGGRDEDPKLQGIAHLAEHMAFKGRQRGKDSPMIWERLLTSGVEFNAFTTEDNTDYYEIGKPDQFNNMVALEADRMRDPLANVTEADFASEREVVVSEFRERLETDPDGMQFSWIMEEVFKNHPYGREVAGNADSIRGIKLDDVRAWYKDHYKPDNAVVVITGPKPANEVIHFVSAAFGGLAHLQKDAPKIEPLPRPAISMPADPAEGAPMVVKHAPVEKPVLWMGWATPGVYAPDWTKGRAVAGFLGNLLNNRFADDERVDDVACDMNPMDSASLVFCRLTLDRAEDADKVAEAARDQLIDFVNEEKSVKYYTALARGAFISDLYLSAEQIEASPIARYLRATGSPDYLGGFQKQIYDSLDSDIGAYAYQWVNRKRAVTMLVAPEKGVGLHVKDEAAPKVGEQFDSPSQATNLSFTTEQILALADKPGLDQAQVKTLSNGLKVIVAKRGSVPLVDVRLVVPVQGGVPHALEKVASQASWNDFNDERTTHWTKVGAKPIQELADDHLVFGGEATSGNLPHLLADASQWVDSPGSDSAVFSKEGRLERADQDVKDRRAHDRGLALLRNALFPGHPYGEVLNADQFKDLDHGAGEKWLKESLRPERSTLIVVGDVEPSEELWKSIDDFFGGWKAPKGESVALKPVTFAPARRILVVHRPRATQSEIFAALAMPPPTADQAVAVGALQWYAGEHLRKILREQQGVTYGVNPFVQHMPLAMVLGLQTGVDQSATGRAVKLVLDQLAELRDKPLADQSVQQARYKLARDYGLRFDRVSSATDALQQGAELKLAADYFDTYPQSIARLNAQSIQDAAKALNVGHEIVVVIGDKEKVLPQLKQTGFEVEVVPDPTEDKKDTK